MRLDKYLKVSRIVKRRTVAKEIADKGSVSVNGRIAKAGTEVSVGDEIEIKLGGKILKLRILAIKENVRANEADSLYEILS